MNSLREQIVERIYHSFEKWVDRNEFVFSCRKGCAFCCTQNVIMTAAEGDIVHRFINENRMNDWFAEKIQSVKKSKSLSLTTNELAGKCLAGKDSQLQDLEETEDICPFLEDNICRIYAARPFMCRSFASLNNCRPGQAAELPQFYITATTAGQQLIEHVSQGQYWGPMNDVLLALCDVRENDATAKQLKTLSVADQARSRLRKSQPLPGFLIGQEDYDKVSTFILTVFNDKIGEKTVEDILNGK